MNTRIAVLASMIFLALGLPHAPRALADPEGSQESEAPKEEKKTASLKIQVSAEGNSSLPAGSKIEWRNLEDEQEGGVRNLEPEGTTPMSLPVCKVKFWIYITGFETKSITLDLAGKEDKYKETVRITVKHKGEVEVKW
jgi:hypothetical protein